MLKGKSQGRWQHNGRINEFEEGSQWNWRENGHSRSADHSRRRDEDAWEWQSSSGCGAQSACDKGHSWTSNWNERSSNGPSKSWWDAGWQEYGQWSSNGSLEDNRWDRWASSMVKAKAKLSSLPAGSLVAVVSFQGSFCPVTTGHVACVVGARGLLLGRKHRGERWVPKGLEEFREVVGLMGCNTDRNITKKLDPLPIIPIEDREALINLAAEEHDWLCSHRQPYEAVEQLTRLFPELRLKHFVLDGADAALWTKPWRRVTDEQRSIIVEREATPGQENGTEALQKSMAKDGTDFQSTPRCILWPQLSSASSTASRRALLAGDRPALERLLHPKVLEHLLKHGPYKGPEACKAVSGA